MKRLDNLHYSFRAIDGYNKPFNFILSPRELGKTTIMWFTKVYKPWKKNHRPWIYLVRTSVEITEALINSISDTIINVFSDDNIVFQYNKGTFKDGITDIKINGLIFVRIVSLSIPVRRIKLAVLQDIEGAFMDEYVINPKFNERYQPKEAEKIQEAYTTWRRAYNGKGIMKMYFLANPYSLYNPLFINWKVDTNKLKRDSFYVGDMFVIHWAILSSDLREHLLKVNPLYQFDEDYSNYALEGCAVNDSNIKIGKLPEGFKLRIVFKLEKKYLGVFQNENAVYNIDDKFYCKPIDEVSSKRVIYCFDFADMVERCQLMGLEERFKIKVFRDALKRGLVSFEDINTYYQIMEVYNYL